MKPHPVMTTRPTPSRIDHPTHPIANSGRFCALSARFLPKLDFPIHPSANFGRFGAHSARFLPKFDLGDPVDPVDPVNPVNPMTHPNGAPHGEPRP
jgi:hypothetical protein